QNPAVILEPDLFVQGILGEHTCIIKIPVIDDKKKNIGHERNTWEEEERGAGREAVNKWKIEENCLKIFILVYKEEDSVSGGTIKAETAL
ncbi:hypothetical protein ACJX0J_037623, partial [Zea mays]